MNPSVAAYTCPACRWEGGGPSDHEPWCPLFMVGPIALEGQLVLDCQGSDVGLDSETAAVPLGTVTRL